MRTILYLLLSREHVSQVVDRTLWVGWQIVLPRVSEDRVDILLTSHHLSQVTCYNFPHLHTFAFNRSDNLWVTSCRGEVLLHYSRCLIAHARVVLKFFIQVVLVAWWYRVPSSNLRLLRCNKLETVCLECRLLRLCSSTKAEVLLVRLWSLQLLLQQLFHLKLLSFTLCHVLADLYFTRQLIMCWMWVRILELRIFVPNHIWLECLLVH